MMKAYNKNLDNFDSDNEEIEVHFEVVGKV